MTTEERNELVHRIVNRLRGMALTNDVPLAHDLFVKGGENPLWDAGNIIEGEFGDPEYGMAALPADAKITVIPEVAEIVAGWDKR